MKQRVIEPVLGICLLAMVILAVKYGSVHMICPHFCILFVLLRYYVTYFHSLSRQPS